MLNVAKTKELIVDFRKTVNTKKPLVINGQAVEQVVQIPWHLHSREPEMARQPK